MNIHIISAGAGSGKTYTLTKQMSELLQSGQIRPTGILATTFTNKAAAELKNRVRVRLLQAGLSEQADELESAMIGTVHSVAAQLLKRFAFEAGLSPEVEPLDENDQTLFFQQALSTISDKKLIDHIQQLAEQLGASKDPKNHTEWRDKTLLRIIEIARANDFGINELRASCEYSISSFLELLPEATSQDRAWWHSQLRYELNLAVSNLPTAGDSTKTTEDARKELLSIYEITQQKPQLAWYEWQRVVNVCNKVGKKSREAVVELQNFAKSHLCAQCFRDDVSDFIRALFDLAEKGMVEFQDYKRKRGLIDYTDMEALLLKLLRRAEVREVLAQELDLLLVDEFQDTSPIQLAIFLELSRIVKRSIWVGDPKQSIYGFRGADLELMEAVIQQAGSNIEILKTSYRSREDLVNGCNGLFMQAFEGFLPAERVVLQPADKFLKSQEAPTLHTAFKNWHFKVENQEKIPKKESLWREKALAHRLAAWLAEQPQVSDNGSAETRPIRPTDIAILCRTNSQCVDMAKALQSQGIKAAIAQTGLLATTEARLVLAFLKYVLNEYDSLALAEILRLYQKMPLKELILSKFQSQTQPNEDENSRRLRWQHDNELVQQLNAFRAACKEFSVSELLCLLLETWEIRRAVASWTHRELRLANIEQLVALSKKYEQSRQQLRSAATLGGFLLWLEQLRIQQKDEQAKPTEAVEVLTYHKSKGLEWKLVICADLDYAKDEGEYGLKLMRVASAIDLQNPLAGQLLRFWPNPYPSLETHAELTAIIRATASYKNLQQKAFSESVRLLYVGFTRAGDYLVLPTYDKKPSKWLNKVCHRGDEEQPAISYLDKSLRWLYQGQEIDLDAKDFELPLHIAEIQPSPQPVFHLPKYSGEKQHGNWLADSPQLFFEGWKCQLLQTHQFAQPFKLPNEENYKASYDSVAQLFGKFIASDDSSQPLDRRYKNVKMLLAQQNLSDFFVEQDFVDRSEAFYRYLQTRWGLTGKNCYLPFRLDNHGLHYQSILPILAQSPQLNALVCIPNNQNGDERSHKEQSSAQGFATLAAAQGLGLAANLIYLCFYPLQGVLYELQFSPPK